MWFRGGAERFERPLLYFLEAHALGELLSVSVECAERGILCNSAERRQSRWPKGVRPELPLWLLSQTACTPYDPFTAEEARTILRHALSSLYVENEAGFFYLATHGDVDIDDAPFNDIDPDYIVKGMYRIRNDIAEEEPTRVRLCGAGSTMVQVIEAARLLWDSAGIVAELWSCPSYTRLARDGTAVARWNLLHPEADAKVSHVERCLRADALPVVAVTGYTRHVAAQIGPFAPGHFTALGADSVSSISGMGQPTSPTARWIALAALHAMANTGSVAPTVVQDALRRFALS